MRIKNVVYADLRLVDLLKSSVIIGAIVMTLLISSVSNVSATGIRYDSGDDSTAEEHDCWIDCYDSGFAGKYDKDRARECVEHSDNYNKTWTQYNDLWSKGCEDSLRTEEELGELINNPVEIEDFEALKAENDRTCNDAGRDDGKAGVYNKERDQGCYEFYHNNGGYEGGYQLGCETHTTESTYELLYEEKQNYS